GDQGIIFGYATNETPEYIPLTYFLSNQLLLKLKSVRREQSGLMPYLRPDAKSQVTIRFDAHGIPQYVDTIIISTQHTNFINEVNAPKLNESEREKAMSDTILRDIREHVLPTVIPAKWINENTKVFVNPTGKFVIGGPHGDAGLTNRKIVVDTYGGVCPHGGGGMSGKDASKVDRSAAYMARYIAKNMVAAGLADQVLLQLAYAIGINQPIAIFVDTYGSAKIKVSDAEIAQILLRAFDFSPSGMEKKLRLNEPKYFPTASYGHMGRLDYKGFSHHWNGSLSKHPGQEVHFFSWEAIDLITILKETF